MELSIRNLCTWVIANLFILFGLVDKAKERAMRGDHILSLYFHNPSRKEFEACIKWLKKNKFKFLSTADLEMIIEHDLPIPMGAVVLTVDDGWESNEANIVEVANKFGIPVTIFVSTEPVEQGAYWWSYLKEAEKINFTHPPKAALKKVHNEVRMSLISTIKKEVVLPREAMTVEQVRRISDLDFVTIGGHTHTHPILVNCKKEQVYNELHISKQKLESWTESEVPYFAFPNGDYSEREIHVLNELGYRMAFSSDPKYLTKKDFCNRYSLPRFGLLEGAPLAENICRMVGVWRPFMLKFRYPKSQAKTKPEQQPIYENTKPPLIAS